MSLASDRTRVAIWASGAGTNARALCSYFSDHPVVIISLIITNNPMAGVTRVADEYSIPVLSIAPALSKGDHLAQMISDYQIDWHLLAGYLKLVPPEVIARWPQRMLNLHPALLPKYGGRGMYGRHVHAAVSAAGDRETGITIHYVTPHFDEGAPVAQYRISIAPHLDPGEIARKVQVLEHYYYPRVAEALITGQKMPAQIPS